MPVIQCIRVGAGVHEGSGCIDAIVGDRQQERRPSAAVTRLGVGAGIEQLDHLGRTATGRRREEPPAQLRRGQ